MSRRGIKPRPVWEDRFALPKRPELLAPFSRQQRGLIDLVREQLLALPSVEESLTWRGLPWRWTFAYSMEGESDRPWAYLIPHPGKPVFVVPMASSRPDPFIDPRRSSRMVREAVAQAMRVGDMIWPQWELSSRALTDELLDIARRRHDSLMAAV
jgi:hypothetical protein